jgi:hypothetical protein
MDWPMNRVTVDEYLMGRGSLFPDELTGEIRKNAEETVKLVNALLAVMEAEGMPFEKHPQTLSLVASGWRPPQINGQVKGAAPKSKHMTGQAVDLYDPNGDIDDFLLSGQGQRVLASLGLYIEHPACTKAWSHIQTVPPRSGNRVFYP